MTKLFAYSQMLLNPFGGLRKISALSINLPLELEILGNLYRVKSKRHCFIYHLSISVVAVEINFFFCLSCIFCWITLPFHEAWQSSSLLSVMERNVYIFHWTQHNRLLIILTSWTLIMPQTFFSIFLLPDIHLVYFSIYSNRFKIKSQYWWMFMYI